MTAAMVLLLIPGPAVLYIIARSVDRGYKAGLASSSGIATGGLVHVLGATLGLSALLVSSALAYSVVKYAGAAYLIYLGIKKLREKPLAGRTEDVPAAPAPAHEGLTRVYAQGVLVQILNPKTAIFFFAFLPQFIGRDEPHPLRHMVELSLVFMALTMVVFVAYGAFAAAVRNHIVSRPRVLTWMRRAFALALIGLAGKLALMA